MKTEKQRWRIQKRLQRSRRGTIRGEFCAISTRKSSESMTTCFSRVALLRMIETWNQKHPEDRISFSRSDSVSILWERLDEKMHGQCSHEQCWEHEMGGGGGSDGEVPFLPPMPSVWHEKPTEWLTSVDIRKVMKQYEKTFSDFLFIGPVPIDFDSQNTMGQCVVEELCRLNVSRLRQQKKFRIGIIFNMDRHDEPGSHWVASFLNLQSPPVLIYFDSTADLPPDEIRVFLRRMEEEMKTQAVLHDVRFQFKDTECGIYCVYFLAQMLAGRSYAEFKADRIDDAMMNRMREEFFNPLA